MDNHPIPQDVTGFEFKLIGSMTIKQFGYVGVGVVLAVVFFYSPLVWYVKYPVMLTTAILGVSLAFLPVAGRPLDLMASYFLKAILKPNQYIYQKTGGSLSFMELTLQPVLPKSLSAPQVLSKTSHSESKKGQQLMNYLYSTTADNTNPLDQKESQYVTSLFNQSISQQFINTTPPAIQESQTPFPQASQDGLPQDPVKIPSVPQPQYSPQNNNSQPVSPKTVLEIIPDKQASANAPTQNLSSNQAKTALDMEFPNLIKGIIKDARGNVLSGILVEVLNKDNESVRAFKTNSLGQFMSATQLVNGSYTITFEDPKAQHKFDNIKIEANGSILPSLSIVSIDAREELRKSLFG